MHTSPTHSLTHPPTHPPGVQLTTHFAKPQLLEGSADATVWSNAPVLDEQLEWVARIASAPLPSGAASAGPPLSVMLYVGFDCDGVVPEAQVRCGELEPTR